MRFSQSEIALIPAFQDNYIFVLRDENNAIVIDPGHSSAVLTYLERERLNLSHILITHHHHDHIGGIADLCNRFRCQVFAPIGNQGQIDGVDRWVKDGEVLSIGSLVFNVIATPGHTLGHICYFEPQRQVLFCGDTLFSAGCGRLFEGDARQMWTSLCKLKALPPSTQIFCAHEYTAANLRFVESLHWQNDNLQMFNHKISRLREQSLPSIPSTIGQELLVNPFLNADSLEIKELLGMERSQPFEVFAELRKRKDRF